MTLSTTMASVPDAPATDLGYLVHKHPGRAQSFPVATGTAHVLWPEATAQRSTVALLLEVDPVALVRGGSGRQEFALSQYVSDRPYAASSMLAVALGTVFRSAIAGRCEARPELAAMPLPLEVHLPALASRGGPELVERLFAPLGWDVSASPVPLDPQLPEWGDSAYVDLHLTGTLTVADALSQLYVLIPVLDDSKHYWVGTDEVGKLLRAGREWLGDHPERDLVTHRYLGHHRHLVADATSRLAALDAAPGDGGLQDDAGLQEEGTEPEGAPRPRPLARLRAAAVLAALHDEGAATVVDLGCGSGALLRDLIADPTFRQVLGVDVSHRALELAARNLGLERMPDQQRARLTLLQSSLTYRDDRIGGYDAVVLMEVVEHVDPGRLPALERSVFARARPTSVLVTTPNAEHNLRYGLAADEMRHPDHRFEWTRAEFRGWAGRTAAQHGYTVRYLPVGEDDPDLGAATQLAIFRRVA